MSKVNNERVVTLQKQLSAARRYLRRIDEEAGGVGGAIANQGLEEIERIGLERRKTARAARRPSLEAIHGF